ncbi:MAG: sulfite exporter TauE/SafE family protein [Nocardioides sp.]|uniref:sulfite exporter TauE/SafE family protein n=1 Tax=Nocardioides sp. TaxID=35761 RepID=UPI0039E484F2
MIELLTWTALSIVVVGFLVGVVVGLTGMGGGALMTPALILLGFGDATAVVTADLTAAAVYKTGGALVHSKHGQPNFRLAAWLIVGSVPMAFLGPFLFHRVAGEGEGLEQTLKFAIGIALLFAATTYALRIYLQLRAVRRGGHRPDDNPHIRPVPTLLVGMLGGALVGITSVGSGSVIMIALLMLYPGLSALRLVGTDLVQAVPLVLAAAIANIVVNHGIDWSLTIPLIVGSVPGSMLGSRIAPKVPQSWIRRGIVVVLVMSGLALLDKAGHGPQAVFEAIGLSGIADSRQFPVFYLLVGVALLFLIPVVWRKLRELEGLPASGHPTVAELDDEEGVGHV